jgi:threonyl-tRNA synthetase
MTYIGADGQKHRPYMVHRALLGSLERFFGVLTEHYAGAFPLWLAPVQAEVITISENQIDYAKGVVKQLKDSGLRVELDDRNEKLGLKIREAQLQKVPYMLVIGAKEAEAGKVAVRDRAKGDLGVMTAEEFVKNVAEPFMKSAFGGGLHER